MEDTSHATNATAAKSRTARTAGKACMGGVRRRWRRKGEREGRGRVEPYGAGDGEVDGE